MISRSLSKIQYEIERYERTINLILLCRNFINNRFKNIKFYPPEENFYTNYQIEPVTPDFSLLDKKQTLGVICEAKAGLPQNEQYLKNVVDEKLNKYLNIIKGWNLDESKFALIDYSLLFIAHVENIDKLRAYLIKKNNENRFKKKVSVWEFQIFSDQYGKGLRFFRIRYYCGKSSIEELDDEANKGFNTLGNDLDRERGTCLFTTDPPVEYTIMNLWIFIFSYFAVKRGQEFEVTIDEIHELIKKQFMRWRGKKTLLRRSWIVDALKKMVEYKLINKEEKNDKYKVKYEKMIKKDFLELIKDRLEKESEKIKEPKIKKRKEVKKRQLKLNNNYMKK